jgi:nucleoside-diphosphate-sugar epimerase
VGREAPVHVLVIGGTQFFGWDLVEQLLDRGDHVTVVSRGRRRPPFWDRVEHVPGDRSDPRTVAAALRGRRFDAVVDNIAFQPQDVTSVLDALGPGAGHYLLTSSGAVYPDFAPPDVFRPVPEEAADLSLRGDGGYAEGKRACEQVLREQQTVPFTVIRPPIVQGPRDPTLRGWFWYQRIRDGGPVIVPRRYPAPIWRQAYSRDVASAIVLAAGNPAAFGKTYNVAGAEIVALEEFVRLAADACGVPDPVVVIPEDDLRRETPWYRPPFLHRFVLDISRATAELGFRPTPLDQWLRDTVRWHLEAELPPAPGYDRRAEERALASRRGDLRPPAG